MTFLKTLKQTLLRDGQSVAENVVVFKAKIYDAAMSLYKDFK